jgi:hypothetical protein
MVYTKFHSPPNLRKTSHEDCNTINAFFSLRFLYHVRLCYRDFNSDQTEMSKEQECYDPLCKKHKPAPATAGEWTPEYVGSLVGETFNGAWKIADAINAALVAEREKLKITVGDLKFYVDARDELARKLAAEREKVKAAEHQRDKWEQITEELEASRDKLESQLDAAVEVLKRLKPWQSVEDAKLIDAALAKIREGK